MNKKIAITTAEHLFLSWGILKTLPKIKHVWFATKMIRHWKLPTKMVVYTNKYICPGNIWWVFIIRVNTRANIICKVTLVKIHWQILFNKFFALCERKYFAIDTLTNIHCQRNIVHGILALSFQTPMLKYGYFIKLQTWNYYQCNFHKKSNAWLHRRRQHFCLKHQ